MPRIIVIDPSTGRPYRPEPRTLKFAAGVIAGAAAAALGLLFFT